METEIELKFFVFPDFIETIFNKIERLNIIEEKEFHFINTYYDTPEQDLRSHRMGLRVRSFDGQHIQTLKTAGRVIAGLHQRPEYNVEITESTPDISLFSNDIWPINISVNDLEQKISPFFSTDFVRKQWLILMPDGSEVEMAFDLGEVTTAEKKDGEADQKRMPICEVELELKSGQINALFSLANDFCCVDGIRLANQSKAAKGYQLAMGEPQNNVKPLSLVKTESTDSVEVCFVNSLEHALSHWQYHEQVFMESHNKRALFEIRISIVFLRQVFIVFGEMIPKRANQQLRDELKWLEKEFDWLDKADHIDYLIEDRGHVLRKLNARKFLVSHLKENANQLPDTEEIVNLLTSCRYCRLLLDLSRWVLIRDWQPFIDEKKQILLQEPISNHSGILLGRTWEALESAFSTSNQLTPSDYFRQKMRLRRNLMTGTCFASIYDEESRKGFRLPWLDLLQGINDVMSLEPLRALVPLLTNEEERDQLERWIIRQERSLLYAMEQTRRAGLEFPPYWT